MADAKKYSSKSSTTEHRMSLMFGAGESNTFTWQGKNATVPIYDLPGAGVQAGFGYELWKDGLFCGINLQLEYARHHQLADYQEDARSGYLDRALGVDNSQAEVKYHYIYESYAEHQNHINTEFLLYMGGDMGDRFYAMGGVKLSAMLYGSYKAGIRMQTRKVYDDIVLPEVEEASDIDGNYGSHYVSPKPGGRYMWLTDWDKGEVANPFRVMLEPMLEAGVRIPLWINGTSHQIRLGAFVEWGVPVLKTSSEDVPLIDYSALESRRSRSGLILMPDNREQLDALIRVNSLLNSEYVSHSMALSLTQLTAGVRLTLLLRGSGSHKCRCQAW